VEQAMRLTKLEHACVRLEKDGSALVVDPGAFGGQDALAGASAVLITHEHFDHVVPDRLRAALAASQELQVWTTAALAGQFPDAAGRVHAVGHGDTFTAAGFSVHVYGSEHAVLHQDIPVIENVGFMLDGEVFHPGDAFTVPEDPVGTLLLPVSAPWLRLSDMIDYAREVAPRRGFAIHDALLSEIGLQVLDNFLPMAAGSSGAQYSRLAPGESTEI
jgi:L-ascorbate metabolism protein UlaG (beta-lactamase superfamily)